VHPRAVPLVDGAQQRPYMRLSRAIQIEALAETRVRAT
jgi:hypothetical protein